MKIGCGLDASATSQLNMAPTAQRPVVFGARTIAGAGGLVAPEGATAISGGTAAGYTLSGGKVYPTSDGSADSGTVTFTGSSEEWNVTAAVDEYSVAGMAEMLSALADIGTAGGKTVRFRDGDYSASPATIALSATSEITIDGDSYRGATLGHMTLDGARNLTFQNVKIYRAFTANKLAAITMINAPSTIKFRFCEIYSDTLAGVDIANLGDSNFVTGIAASPSTALTPNLEVYGCHLHDLEQSCLVNGDGITLQGNYFEDMVASSFFFGGGNSFTCRDNDGDGIGLSDADDGTFADSAHQALNGYGTLLTSDEMTVVGNRFFATDRRWTYKGDRHSDGVRGFNVDDPAPPVKHDNLTMHHNIFVGSTADALALEQFKGADVYYNTVSRDSQASQTISGSVGIKVEDFDAANIVANIGAVSLGAGAFDQEVLSGSYLNAPTVAYSGFPASIQSNEINSSNYATHLTPEVGSFWEGKGAIGTGFTFATGQGTNAYSPSVNSSAMPTKPGTTTATGQTPVAASFNEDATLDMLSAPASSFSPATSNQITVAMGFELNDDTEGFSYPFYAMGGGQAVWIRRASGTINIRIGDLINVNIPGTFDNSRGFVNLVFTYDGNTGEFRYAVDGEVIDMADATTAFEAGSLSDSWFNDLYIAASSGTGANATDMTLGYLWIDSVFVDFDTQVQLDAWCAQDGGAPNFGEAGALIGFSQPTHLLRGGDATTGTWPNAGSGSDWVVTGAPALPAAAPSAIIAPQWSVSDLGTGGDIRITIATAPANGGSPITEYQYSIDNGAWTFLGTTAATDYDISGFTDGVEVSVEVRAVNAVAAGTDSDAKLVTPTGAVGYSMTLFDTQGTAWIQDATVAHADGANLEFSCWIIPQTVSGTQRLFTLRNASYVELIGDRLRVNLEDTGGTTCLTTISNTGLLSIGTLYHIYMSWDGGSNVEIRVNGTLPAGMTETVSTAGNGAVEATLQWNLLSERSGATAAAKISDIHFGDFWLDLPSALNGYASFHDMGIPKDLTSLGIPAVWLGGGQSVSDLNSFLNGGTASLSAGSSTFQLV